jgi:hypothetical protein
LLGLSILIDNNELLIHETHKDGAMRLSTEDVILGLQHDSVFVRDTLLDYFEGALAPPISLTHAVISVIRRHGWEDSFCWPHKVGRCTHDEDSLNWCLQEIEDLDSVGGRSNLLGHLTSWVTKAPIDLLRKYRDRIVEMQPFRSAHFGQTPAKRLDERLRAWTHTPQECWDEIEHYCHSISKVESFSDANIPRLETLLEPIAAHGGEPFRRLTLEVLKKTVEDSSGAQGWWGGLMMKLAAMMQMEESSLTLLQLFDTDWDWYNEGISEALRWIGTPEIQQQVIAFYPGKPWYVRNYLSGPLESIRYDGAAEKIMPLLALEEDAFLRIQLAVAMTSQFDEAAIETGLQVYHEDPDDPERGAIIENLFALSSVAKLDLPEAPQWEAEIKSDWDRFQNNANKPEGLLQRVSELIERGSNRPPRSVAARAPAITAVESFAPRVGRNEPCPCGSGKKHKKCCLQNSHSTNDYMEF